MNRLKTIVLFAGIFAISLGAVSLSDSSATSLMVSAEPQTTGFDMLGHVEYQVLDNTGTIKHYLQGDNIVVIGGKDCVSRLVFENSTSSVCPLGNNEFQFIAIGNQTTVNPPVNTLAALETTSAGNCASTTVDGEMARKQVVPTFTPSVTGTGTIVVLDTSSDPFDFGAGNATGPIMQSGVFNGPEGSTTSGTGECATLGSTSMFAVQDLNSDTGITVSTGDSLSVKWTITVG